MQKITPLVACLLAVALTGCGGGGDGKTNPVTDASTVNAGNDSGVQTEFPLRSTKQGDERTYEFTDIFSDDSTFNYSKKIIQTVLNADGSGERQIFNGSNKLVEIETLVYDQDGSPFLHFASTNVTCKYSAQRKDFTSPARVGQAYENNFTETCNNGGSSVIDEKRTIVGSETITVNDTSYSTLKATITENVAVTPPPPAQPYSYLATRTQWFEPSLGLVVKENTSYTLTSSNDAVYRKSRNVTLKSYLNK